MLLCCQYVWCLRLPIHPQGFQLWCLLIFNSRKSTNSRPVVVLCPATVKYTISFSKSIPSPTVIPWALYIFMSMQTRSVIVDTEQKFFLHLFFATGTAIQVDGAPSIIGLSADRVDCLKSTITYLASAFFQRDHLVTRKWWPSPSPQNHSWSCVPQ